MTVCVSHFGDRSHLLYTETYRDMQCMVVGDAPSIEPLADVESSSKNSRGGKRPSLWKVQSAGVVWVW